MSSTLSIDKGIEAQQLETLINSAPKDAILEFGAGNYDFDNPLTITRSDITLKGAGSGETTLTFSNSALDNEEGYAIQVNGGDSETLGKLTNDAEEGEHRITLNNAGDLEPGDTLRLWQDNDSAFFEKIGDTAWRKDNAPLRTSMARVESVEGSTVTLDRGVHFDFEGGKTQVERLDVVNDVILQGFDITFELGTPDNKVFKNTLSDLKDFMAVCLHGTVDSQLSDIQVINGPSIAYHFVKTLDNHVDSIQAHGAFNKGSGGNGYAYELRESYDGNYTNLIDSGMRHSLLFASWRSSVGNDAHVSSTDRDINFHGGRDHDNTVRVDQSVRGADNISTSLWINEGGVGWGAITDGEDNQVTFDYLVGSRRDDIIQGSDGGVYLNGGLGNDTLRGGQGDDILQGGPADDWGKNLLAGGDGNDIVYYMQDYDTSDVHLNGKHARVGKDTLQDIEQVIFGDGTVVDIESGRNFQGDTPEIPTAEEILESEGNGMGSASAVHLDAKTYAPLTSPAGPEDISSPQAPMQSGSDASAGSDVAVSGRIKSEWDDGYVAEVFMENTTNERIVDPELRFALPDDLDTVWNGTANESGEGYRISDTSTNVLDPGEVWRFAFKAYGNDKTLPSEMNVQGEGTETMQTQLLGIDGSPAAELLA